MKKKNREVRLQGISICDGIAIGTPFYFALAEERIEEFFIEDQQIETELARYRKALQRSKQEVQKIKLRLEQERAWDGVAILDTHLYMLQDPSLTEAIEEQIRGVRRNTESALQATMAEYQMRFNKISDSFFQERFKDVQDVTRRIIHHLHEDTKLSFADLPIDAIVFSEELSPSDAAEAKSTFIGAFVTRKGGGTSHTAIIAKAQGIPYVANIDLGLVKREEQKMAIVDGFKGEVLLNPSKDTIERYQELLRVWRSRSIASSYIRHLPAETLDKEKVTLLANIDTIQDIDSMQEHGGEGVGLFRSEALLLAQGSFPSEEEQFTAYKNMIEKVRGCPIALRTFDIGGDKFGRCYVMRREDNPFLGCRAIRLMLKEKEIFKTQLRAMLRASAFGKVRVMLPMVSSVSEVREVKALIEKCKCELKKRKRAWGEYEIGCMIEVPSAALIADSLAKECDFLSLGTNDLTQYCLAVDRGNQLLASLYNCLHPAILKMIKMVVDAAAARGVSVTLCGEMAGDPRFTKLLLGLGIKELSVIPRAIPSIKSAVRGIELQQAQAIAVEALKLALAEDIYELITK